jgi:hypothetical protein
MDPQTSTRPPFPNDGQPAAPKPRKHLMVPGAPRPAPRPNAMSTEQVQKWVVTVLVVVVVGHLAEALVIFALMAPQDHPASRIGLLIIAGVVGLLGAGGVRAVHRRRPLSTWLLLGLLPAASGVYLGYWA